MNSISFLRSTLIALILSAGGAVIFLSISSLFGSALGIRATISAVTFGYLLYLLSNAELAFGKLSFVSVYSLGILALLYFWPSTMVYALYHAGFIWLLRTVYWHNNFFHALIDLAFSAVSFTAAVAAIVQSGSVFMSLWSFFLTQALILPVLRYFFYEPNSLFFHSPSSQHSTPSNNAKRSNDDDNFHQAHRNAEKSLRKLARNI